jgi:hypothetical protein
LQERKEASLTTIVLIAALAGALAAVLAAILLFVLNRTIRRGLGTLAPPEPRASVTATLELSPSNRNFVDLVVANTGAEPAFDVRIGFLPEIPAPGDQDKRSSGWADVSLLRPGQAVANFACETGRIGGLDFEVEVSWKSGADARSRTSLAYTLKTTNLERQVPLSAPDADSLLAEVRRLRRDWQPVARGRQSLQVELSPEATRSSGERSSTDTAKAPRRQRV